MRCLRRSSLALAGVLVACAAGTPPARPAAVASPAPPPGTDPHATVAAPAGPASPGQGQPEPGGPPAMTWKEHDMGVAVPGEWRTCSASSDCTLVVTTCCDPCNGGRAVAVSTARARDAEALRPGTCAGVVCTERGCLTRAACEAGRCVMQWLTGAP